MAPDWEPTTEGSTLCIEQVSRLRRAALLATAVGLLVLGPTHLTGLFRTGRAKIQAEAENLIDPAEELKAKAEALSQTLPAEMAALKMALRDGERALAAQAGEISTLTQGLALVESDLKELSPAVQAGQACRLRGRTLSAAEAGDEAARLLRKRNNYREMIAGRSALVEKVRRQQAELQRQLARGEAAIAELASRTQSLQSKIALVKASEAIEAAKTAADERTFAVVPSSLDELERRLDQRIEEAQQRRSLADGLGADEHLESVRHAGLLAELRKFSGAAAGDKEKRP